MGVPLLLETPDIEHLWSSFWKIRTFASARETKGFMRHIHHVEEMVRSFPSFDKNMLQLEMPRNIIRSIYIHVYIVYYCKTFEN